MSGRKYAISRRRLRVLVTLSLLFISALLAADRYFLDSEVSSHSVEVDRPIGDYQRYNGKSFVVTNVVDGDTFDIEVPDGNSRLTRIRLWGVDTPETKSKASPDYFGPQATQFTKEKTLNKKVTVYLDDEKTRCYYGRLLAYVKLADGTFLNEELISEGFAYADLRYRHDYYIKYQQLESIARSEREGLWENVTRNQLPEWLQKNKPNLLKKK